MVATQKAENISFITRKKQEFQKLFMSTNLYGIYVIGAKGGKFRVQVVTIPYDVKIVEVDGIDEDIQYYTNNEETLRDKEYSLVSNKEISKGTEGYYGIKKLGFKPPSPKEVNDEQKKYVLEQGVNWLLNKQVNSINSHEKAENAKVMTERLDLCVDKNLMKQLGFTSIRISQRERNGVPIKQTIYIKEIPFKGYVVYGSVIGVYFDIGKNKMTLHYNYGASRTTSYATSGSSIANLWVDAMVYNQTYLTKEYKDWLLKCMKTVYNKRSAIKPMKII